ncbi:MAG: hypothetical protein WDA16_13195, partial [Candidatus Thermoplasmatota archaeon]
MGLSQTSAALLPSGVPGVTNAPWAGWSVSVVDPGYPRGVQSLALDSLGRPHIAYTGDANVSYAYRDGLEWRLTTVMERSVSPDIALDASDTPHLCFNNANLSYPTGIYYATKTQTGWAF